MDHHLFTAHPTTDLLLYSESEVLRLIPEFALAGLAVSLARSGDSPESVGVISRFQRMFPGARHLAITCNEQGQLAQFPGVTPLVLDPRTNDRSLVMTSSFSNLTLAGQAIAYGDVLAKHLPRITDQVNKALPDMESLAKRLASSKPSRVAVLSSAELVPLGKEACMKILEMTAGCTTILQETFLGLHHGPLSFLRTDTLTLCLLSSSTERRRYEEDLLRELRQKNLGRLVVIGPPDSERDLAHEFVPCMAPDMPEHLRAPFDIVFAQILGFYLSLAWGLDPDNPSPDGVITRVVQKFRLYEQSGAG